MTLRSEELTSIISNLKSRIKEDCQKIAESSDLDSGYLTTFRDNLRHSITRLKKYEKELEMIK
jgi:hypothetical protein